MNQVKRFKSRIDLVVYNCMYTGRKELAYEQEIIQIIYLAETSQTNNETILDSGG